MIAQIWRGRTRAEDRHAFSKLLQERIEAELAISQACQGAYVLQRQVEGGQAESLVVTLYDRGASAGPARAASPDPTSQAARLLVSCDLTPARYEVVVDPPRALLYAELRRRFPLRLAAVR